MDQSLYPYKIAAYLAIEIAPRLRELTGRPTLGWENFLRRVESGGRESTQALHHGSPPPTRGIRHARADWYVLLLFGVAPLVLLTLYVKASPHTKVGLGMTVRACLLGGLLWLFAISRFIDFAVNTKVINRAIVAAGTRPEIEPEA